MNNLNYTQLKLKFLLRKENQILMPTNDHYEMKEFIFWFETNIIKELLQDKNTLIVHHLYEELISSLYFNEFLIQLFQLQFEIFIASISFVFNDITYCITDMCEENFSWISKEEPKEILDTEYARVETDIYKFDNYMKEIGIEKINFNFHL